MKQVDYIVIGCGLAGLSFIELLHQNNKSVMVFDNESQQSSTVAGGMYNPVILKRFSAVWKSKEQLDIALPFYKNLESGLKQILNYEVKVLRRFNSTEEQNDWFSASDKPDIGEFLSTTLIKNSNAAITADFGFGEVLKTGRIDTAQLISAYKSNLLSKGELVETKFEYESLKVLDKGFQYTDIEAKYIVFAEGFGMKSNPYFNYLPLNGTKGELLLIHAPGLKIDYILKSGVFLIPLGNDYYKVGATYEWSDKTNNVTETAKNELLTKLKLFVNCEFTVVDQVAGIRPTVKDRRPLVGEHPNYKNMFVLNGLGTRGVMIGPYVADKLFKAIENEGSLDPEIDITRFSN